MNRTVMRPATSRRPALLLAAGLLIWVAGGCSRDESTSETVAAAKAATPSPFPSRLTPLIPGSELRATPRPSDVAAGGKLPKKVTISTDADPDSGGAPLAVQFKAEVSGGSADLRYRWDFGDNSVPAHQLNVEHTYQNTGEYTATFSVSGPDVYETDEVPIEVTEEGFDVSIEADPDIGIAPLTVQFSAVLDDDLPGPFYYAWDFGDGARDVSNPTNHTYRDPGQYTAVLTVTNGLGQIGRGDVEIQVDPRDENADPQ